MPETSHDGAVVDDGDLEGFGARVRVARERLGMGQSALADAVRTDVGTISRWERGAGYPQTPQLVRLAMALGESLDHLVLGAARKGPVVMPPAFLAFLATEYGRIAQQRAYLQALLSVRTLREPTVGFYQAITAGLMMDGDS